MRAGQQVIVDNADESRVTISGRWKLVHKSNAYGPTALLNRPAGRYVAFSPDLPAPGTYEVHLHYLAGKRRASNVTVVVNQGNQRVTLHHDMRKNRRRENWGCNHFQSIGQFEMHAVANAGQVLLSAVNADGKVMADAVKWVCV